MMKYSFLVFFSVLFSTMPTQKLDIQGHRGCRGLLPENTIPAFIKALELGVTTVEMDVVISKDKQVVVSHEPYMSATICLLPNGQTMTKEEGKSYNLYEMTYDEIFAFDCGSKKHPKYPHQTLVSAQKPLLGVVIDTLEQMTAILDREAVFYNIELKSDPKKDEISQPIPSEFVSLVLDIINQKGIASQVTLQSFDWRILREIKKQAPNVRIAQLVYNTKKASKNIAELGFAPDIYSPHYALVRKKTVRALQEQGIAVIPWTVNKEKDMRKMIKKGVDGIITDYPDKLLELIRE